MEIISQEWRNSHLMFEPLFGTFINIIVLSFLFLVTKTILIRTFLLALIFCGICGLNYWQPPVEHELAVNDNIQALKVFLVCLPIAFTIICEIKKRNE